MRLFYTILFCAVSLTCSCALNAISKIDINIKRANLELSNIEKLLQKQPDDLSELNKTNERLEKLIEDAKLCINESKNQADLINDVIAFVPKTLNSSGDGENDFEYIKNKQSAIHKMLTDCKIIEYRAKELNVEAKSLIYKIDTSNTIQKNTSILLNFKFLSENGFKFDLIKIPKVNTKIISILIALFILHFGYKLYFHRLIFKNIKNQLAKSLIYYLFPITIFSIYTSILLHQNQNTLNGTELIMSAIVTGYFALSFLLKYNFEILSEIKEIDSNKLTTAKLITTKTLFLCSIILTFYTISYELDLNFNISHLISKISFALIVIVTFFYFKNIISLNMITKHRKFKSVMYFLLAGFSIAILLLVMSGYQLLSEHLLKVATLSAMIFLSTTIVLQLSNVFVTTLSKWFLSFSNNPDVYKLSSFEMDIAKVCIFITIISIASILLLHAIEISPSIINPLHRALVDGFSIYNLVINPLRLLLAVFVFSILQFLSKTVLDIIFFKNTDDEDEEDQKETILYTIYYYLGILVNIIIGLLISGVSVTSLTIIAGALSVGIGLGLQNIMNNFFSGIILLIEKPIKPGDRISIGGKDGFVKKINFRATIVTTIEKEDLIIPNSELIGKSIINYVLKNSLARINCTVGVAYDSDINLVRDTLLEIALKNPNTLKSKKHYPVVIFSTFGDSSLEFNLWCTIADINQKYTTKSDLNYQIMLAFREKNIDIAFPQLDVHLSHNT